MQLKAIERHLNAFGERQLDLIEMNSNPEGTEFTFHARAEVLVDPSLPLAIGECLFNLRSALDHLVYQLHAHFLGSQFTPQLQKAAMFPVFSDAGSYADKGKWRVKHLPTAQQAQIERLQPYNGGDLSSDPIMLGLLDRMHAIDKHRHLHLVWQAATIVPAIRIPAEFGFECENYGVPLKPNATLARWRFAISPKMEVKTATAIRIFVSDGGTEIDCGTLLFACKLAVAAVIADLGSVLPAN